MYVNQQQMQPQMYNNQVNPQLQQQQMLQQQAMQQQYQQQAMQQQYQQQQAMQQQYQQQQAMQQQMYNNQQPNRQVLINKLNSLTQALASVTDPNVRNGIINDINNIKTTLNNINMGNGNMNNYMPNNSMPQQQQYMGNGGMSNAGVTGNPAGTITSGMYNNNNMRPQATTVSMCEVPNKVVTKKSNIPIPQPQKPQEVVQNEPTNYNNEKKEIPMAGNSIRPMASEGISVEKNFLDTYMYKYTCKGTSTENMSDYGYITESSNDMLDLTLSAIQYTDDRIYNIMRLASDANDTNTVVDVRLNNQLLIDKKEYITNLNKVKNNDELHTLVTSMMNSENELDNITGSRIDKLITSRINKILAIYATALSENNTVPYVENIDTFVGDYKDLINEYLNVDPTVAKDEVKSMIAEIYKIFLVSTEENNDEKEMPHIMYMRRMHTYLYIKDANVSNHLLHEDGNLITKESFKEMYELLTKIREENDLQFSKNNLLIMITKHNVKFEISYSKALNGYVIV